MPAVQLGPFAGALPRIAREYLPGPPSEGVHYAVRAVNCDVSGGVLRPLTQVITVRAVPGSPVSLLVNRQGATLRTYWWDIPTDAVPALTGFTPSTTGTAPELYLSDGVLPRWRDAGGAEHPLKFPDRARPVVHYTGSSAANALPRAYVWTYVNPWGWESQPSFPTTFKGMVDDGATVQVEIPGTDTTPHAANYVNRVRLYRTKAGNIATGYFRVGEYPLPITTTRVTDSVPDRRLQFVLDTEQDAPPPDALEGLTVANNGAFVGFVGNTLYVSRPGRPWAWPIAQQLQLPEVVVAVAVSRAALVVLTDGYPYVVLGNPGGTTPLQYRRLDQAYPCVSRQSVVAMNDAVVYASTAGLVRVSNLNSVASISQQVYDWDTVFSLPPAEHEAALPTIHAVQHKGRYLGAFGPDVGQPMFLFDTEATGGPFVRTMVHLDTRAMSVDVGRSVTYGVTRQGNLIQIDNPSGASAQPSLLTWESGTITLPASQRWTALRVEADFAGAQNIASDVTPPAVVSDAPQYPVMVVVALYDSGATNVPSAQVRLGVSSSRIVRFTTGRRARRISVQIYARTTVRRVWVGASPVALRAV